MGQRRLKQKVLVVEDDLAALVTEVVRLELTDYDLLTATDGATAVIAASAHRDTLALVIMDLMLPRLPGVEAIRKIREFLRDVPIVAITAYGESMRGPAMAAGATAFYVKDDVVAAIKQIRQMLKGKRDA